MIFNKSFGQHILINSHILKRMVGKLELQTHRRGAINRARNWQLDAAATVKSEEGDRNLARPSHGLLAHQEVQILVALQQVRADSWRCHGSVVALFWHLRRQHPLPDQLASRFQAAVAQLVPRRLCSKSSSHNDWSPNQAPTFIADWVSMCSYWLVSTTSSK